MYTSTFGSISTRWPTATVSQVGQPGIFDCWFENMAVIQALDGPEVAAQILHRLNMVLLLRGEDWVECLQLVPARTASMVETKIKDERSVPDNSHIQL